MKIQPGAFEEPKNAWVMVMAKSSRISNPPT